VAYQDLSFKGSRELPGYKWQFISYSNQLVPLYARGPGAALFRSCSTKQDSYSDAAGHNFGCGAYLDQTDIFAIMSAGRCSL
jgi:hypothetical protein